MPDIRSRKSDHLDLCATDQVAFQQKTTLLEEVEFVHQALPERSVEQVDLSTQLVGKDLQAPVVIAAMTGGVERAARINRDLASVAEELGIAFGFGSMRPLLDDPTAPGYQVRDVAPNALIFGNIGIVQARDATNQQLSDLVGNTGCDALCVHMNAAQEMVQEGGDRDFTDGLDTLSRLVDELDVPIIAKETGCGISRVVGHQLAMRGVEWVDVSGAGGTSWVGVETLRARTTTRTLGEAFWDWGIPTGASVAQLSGVHLGIIATGGIANGLDIARALALGAKAGGMARPFLQAWTRGGREAAASRAKGVIDEIRVACLLTGSGTISELAEQSLVLGTRLRRWVPRDSPLHQRLLGI